MSLIEDLSTRLWKNPRFQSDYRDFVRQSFRKKLKIEQKSSSDLIVLKRLLQCALHFSGTTQPDFLRAAYQIAVAALQADSTELAVEEIREIARLIFNRLGNFPALSLVYGQDSYANILSPGVWYQCEFKEIQNSIYVQNRKFVLTDFQRDFWNQLAQNSQVMSVSAPTSAGKSFILKNYLLDRLSELTSGICFYIVPSRALIGQVYEDFLSSVAGDIESKIFISTAPISPSEFKEKVGLYILTQERLQALLDNLDQVPNVPFVVVDEAQNISADSRGVLLQSTLERLLSLNPETRMIFSCPFAENIEIFGRLFYGLDDEPLKAEVSPVAQNLFVLNPNYAHKKLNIHLVADGMSTVGEKDVSALNANLENPLTLLCIAADQISEPPTIIYSPGPGECEDIALEMCKIRPVVDDEELRDFSEFVKAQIHPQFSLAQVVLHGVAFHYGPLPAIVRRGIEDLFSRGKIQYLVCTSTLLQGVNLPAKNIFIMRPTKGGYLTSDIPLTGAEFWNLAGRAGRLQKELEGNVFLVDYQNWKHDPLRESKKYEIKPALYEGLQRSGSLLSLIRDKDHVSGAKELEESAFMKLLADFEEGVLDQTLAEAGIESSAQVEISKSVSDAAAYITMPSDLYLRNPAISAYRQQQLFDYLMSRVVDEPSAIERIPMHPKSDSYKNLSKIFYRVISNFERNQHAMKFCGAHATFALKWMRGNAVSHLVQDRIDYKKKKKTRMIGTDPTVREVLRQIEDDLRFKYVKFTKCYLDILCYILEKRNLGHLVEKIPSIPLYLELGCSSKTMVNLIGLGLSRTTASLLTGHIHNDEMGIEEIKNWLNTGAWSKLTMPRVCMREIQRLVGG